MIIINTNFRLQLDYIENKTMKSSIVVIMIIDENDESDSLTFPLFNKHKYYNYEVLF